MASGVCSLWGWGLAFWTPTFLMRTYDLNVAQAGAVTGRAHLVGGLLATAGAAWLMARPYMVSPRRVLGTLAAVIGLATIPSVMAYWTRDLWVAKLMFWIYIPAIYFFIGPCMALVLNLAPSNMRSVFTAWSVLVGNVFNLIVAPQMVGIMSDFFARGHTADAAHHCALPRVAGARTDRILGRLAFHLSHAHRRRGSGARHRLRQSP